MTLSSIEFCRPLPDGDKMFEGVPPGCSLCIDEVLYVRQSEWLNFLESLRSAHGGQFS